METFQHYFFSNFVFYVCEFYENLNGVKKWFKKFLWKVTDPLK